MRRSGAARARRRLRSLSTLVPFAALGLFLPAALLAQREYRIGPPPAWVKPLAADLTSSPLERNVTAGSVLLLVDRQESAGGAGPERYRHIVYRLLDQEAVDEYSQIELSFDPSYERLTLHTATVTRNGRTTDQLKPGRIRVARSESEIADHIFDGSLSLVLVLEDVRPGDVVDYSYTRRGANPVFAGHYTGAVAFQATVPLRALRFRLLWPSARPLFVGRHGAAPEPVVTTAGAQREYVWSAADVPPKLLDAGLPDWYDPFPEVQLGDFASWAQVAAWGDTLFSSPGPLPAALMARLGRIRSADPSPEAQALAALRYVQDEVRYVGVEIGVNSHRPYPVATVLRRGYGDCKDKAQLLVALLRQLGFPAQPALVSTAYEGHLRDFQPTAAYFDHAIVRTEIGGRAYWLDPTATYQRGDLPGSAPRFGAALVLGGAGDSLATIPDAPAAGPLIEVAVSFELADAAKPATMRVDTRYRGRAADRARAATRGVSPEKLQQEYTEYYAEGYPGIRSQALPRIADDEAANRLRTIERYTIPNFWHQAANQPGFVGTFDPVELEHAVPAPTATGRTMPLAVDHPTFFSYTITAHLSGGWAIAPRTDSVATPALRFVRSIAVEGQDLTLRYEYETLADHVVPAAAGDHLEKVSRVRRLLTFSVTPPDTGAGGAGWADPREWNWPVLLAGLFALAFAVAGAIRVQRSPPPAWPRGPATPGDGVSGLGGWLGLVGLGVCLTPLVLVVRLVRSAPAYTASAWALRTTPGGGDYHALWAPTLLLELVGNAALLVFGCLLVWQFFRRKRWFPALFVIVSVARLLLIGADALLAGAIPAVSVQESGAEGTQNWSMLLATVLWVGYMFRSRRVRNTFVN
jgi:transglutaminase-like putative cysteine protease